MFDFSFENKEVEGDPETQNGSINWNVEPCVFDSDSELLSRTLDGSDFIVSDGLAEIVVGDISLLQTSKLRLLNKRMVQGEFIVTTNRRVADEKGRLGRKAVDVIF